MQGKNSTGEERIIIRDEAEQQIDEADVSMGIFQAVSKKMPFLSGIKDEKGITVVVVCW